MHFIISCGYLIRSTFSHNLLPEMTDSYQKRSDRIFYYIDLAGYKMCKPKKTCSLHYTRSNPNITV